MEDLTNHTKITSAPTPHPIRHCRMFCGVLPKNVTFLPVAHSFLDYLAESCIFSLPAALFGAISAVFSGKHPAINIGRKRYIYFQEKIHIMSHRESFIIPYISPPRYALWEILDNFTVVVFFHVSFLLKYSGLEHFSPELSSEEKLQTRKHLNIDEKKVFTES